MRRLLPHKFRRETSNSSDNNNSASSSSRTFSNENPPNLSVPAAAPVNDQGIEQHLAIPTTTSSHHESLPVTTTAVSRTASSPGRTSPLAPQLASNNRRASDGDTPPMADTIMSSSLDFSNLRSSIRSNAPLYPTLHDIPTPQVPWRSSSTTDAFASSNNSSNNGDNANLQQQPWRSSSTTDDAFATSNNGDNLQQQQHLMTPTGYPRVSAFHCTHNSNVSPVSPSKPVTNYPSGLVIQPLSNRAVMFGRKSSSSGHHELEETEDIDDFELLASVDVSTTTPPPPVQALVQHVAPPPPLQASQQQQSSSSGPLFGKRSTNARLDLDGDDDDNDGFSLSAGAIQQVPVSTQTRVANGEAINTSLPRSMQASSGVAAAAAATTYQPHLQQQVLVSQESTASAFCGIPMAPTKLDSIPSAPRNDTDEEEKREVSATIYNTTTTTTTPQCSSSTVASDARTAARELLDFCALPQVPAHLLDYLTNLLSDCEGCQERLIREISTHPESVEELFEVNDYLLNAIRKGCALRDAAVPMAPDVATETCSSIEAAAGEQTLGRSTSHVTNSSYSSLPALTSNDSMDDYFAHQREEEATTNGASINDGVMAISQAPDISTVPSEPPTPVIEVDQLVDNKDVFSLICMLRSQQDWKRLEAALALMAFARNADAVASEENIQVRDEIRSSGGMHSLLAVFRIREISHELKVVVALAVAYLLPSFVGSQTPPSLGLKIMDCLRLLSNARTIEPRGEVISRDESFKAGAKGLFLFWINQVEPMLEKGTAGPLRLTDGNGDGAVPASASAANYGHFTANTGGGMFDQRRESIEMQELLEITVTLIIYMARDEISTIDENGENLNSWRCTLLEQVCAVEAARPIAVREGILGIIVEWIRSKDPEKIRTASSALSHLTSIEDKYMAGWIHSQMVNEGVLQGIVTLFDENEYGFPRDVQLAIARILSSLCVAPHTRAAVVEANGVTPLIQFLCEHRDRKEGAFFAGRALLKLAAGAITRANVFGEDDLEIFLLASSDKQDVVVQQIIDSGAINHFVEMALSDEKKLRSVAVEALRVLSEDTNTRRQTRSLLCRIGAAKALGVTLKQCLSRHDEELHQSQGLKDLNDECFKDLHEAVCGLANILDPIADPKHQRNREASGDIRELLIHGCKETAESGGLGSLLCIASRLCVPSDGVVDLQLLNLLVETCRSLASMAPLLLSESIAEIGYSHWADDVLFGFYKVLRQVAGTDCKSPTRNFIKEVQDNVLRGVAALAWSEPLKIRVVDKLLPYLLQDDIIRYGGEASTYINQTFQCLEFTDDDLAGNSPQILADLFCLERSFIIQSMARQEIRQLIGNVWAFAVKESSDPMVTHLIREMSDFSRSDDSSACDNLFENFTTDKDTALLRDSMIKQYRDMYAGELSNEKLQVKPRSSGDAHSSDNLLSRQVYPFSSSETETHWILSHDLVMRNDEQETDNCLDLQLSSHVRTFLEGCFPSPLLQDIALPIYKLRSQASFNFRSLLMPQRRYFSFRREGQLLSRVCAREEAQLGGSQAHWLLGFTNSSFSGEFSESLVQALYLCPMIRGLTFSKRLDITVAGDAEVEVASEEGGAILAILAGSLPPWISNLTFDGLLNDRDMKALVSILETMGRLSATRELPQLEGQPVGYGGQGRYCFFAVRRSPKIQASSWAAFFKLLGDVKSPLSALPVQAPLSSLTVLDLSGNQLGDELCASLLALVHDKDSGCSLEQLDLSGNRILAGNAVLKVLTGYVDHFRYNHRTGRSQTRKGWKSPLHTLYLANNGLHLGKAWLELVTLLKHNALELHSLDLSANGLVLNDHDLEFMNVLVSALLKNTCLTHFNLSGNKFSQGAIDHILNELSSAMNDSVLGFLRLNGNIPELTAPQKSRLGSLCVRARKMLLQRFMSDRQAQKDADINESSLFYRDHDGIVDERHLLTIVEDDDTSPAVHAHAGELTSKGDNMITVLFSAPLVYTDERNRLCPFAKLEFTLEREHMWQCLKEASRDIELSFDTATHDRFLAAISKRCGCLHYSGHGHPDFLPFEDKGGPQWFSVQKIKDIIKREEGASFRFVFVSACHSENAGRTFAEAGVPHVVCCRQESELKDTAAIAFTRQFYLSLAVGNTVKEAFDLGCNAVRATPNLRDAEREMDKFRLLPEDGNHQVTIFNAKPVYEWPVDKNGKGRRGKRLRHAGGTRASELSVRNMIQEDPSPLPPEHFLGREVEMYHLLRLVLETRLVSVTGEAGIGRSSLACALCHYINERASTMTEIEQIYFVKTKQHWTANRAQAVVWRLLQKLAEANKIQELPDENSRIEVLSEIVCRILKNDKVLVVFDRVDLLEDTDEISEFPMFLGDLLRETRNVKVLLTNRHTIGIPSLGEKTIRLGPLTFSNSVRLFASAYPSANTPRTRRLLRQSLITVPDEEDLLPTDPDLPADVAKVFKLIGDGVPSSICKAAHSVSTEDYQSLLNGAIRNRPGFDSGE